MTSPAEEHIARRGPEARYPEVLALARRCLRRKGRLGRVERGFVHGMGAKAVFGRPTKAEHGRLVYLAARVGALP